MQIKLGLPSSTSSGINDTFSSPIEQNKKSMLPLKSLNLRSKDSVRMASMYGKEAEVSNDNM